MHTVVTFLEALVVSGSIVYAIYGFMRLSAYCVLWVVRAIRRRGDAASNEVVRDIQTSTNVGPTPADGIAARPHDPEGDPRVGMSAADRPPSFSDILIYVRQAREALSTDARRAFSALCEMREAAARALGTIAQARALNVEADATPEHMCAAGGGVPLVAVSQSQCPVAPITDPTLTAEPVNAIDSGSQRSATTAIGCQTTHSQSASVASTAGA